MFRTRYNMARTGALPRKLAGIVLAVVGIALMVDKVPGVVWWACLGMGLVFAGWKIFTG